MAFMSETVNEIEFKDIPLPADTDPEIIEAWARDHIPPPPVEDFNQLDQWIEEHIFALSDSYRELVDNNPEEPLSEEIRIAYITKTKEDLKQDRRINMPGWRKAEISDYYWDAVKDDIKARIQEKLNSSTELLVG